MGRRENLIRLYKRKGYDEVPVFFDLCPDLVQVYKNEVKSDLAYDDYFGFPSKNVPDGILENQDTQQFKKYYDFEMKPGTIIDPFGVAHEPGSEAARHMTQMHHPLKNCDSLEMMKEYPFPDFQNASYQHQAQEVKNIHNQDKVACGHMQMTIWETAWYIRGMEDLMMDMMTEDPMAEFLLDKITEISTKRAVEFTKANCDMLFLGDDVGMQNSTMMSEDLYCTWLKPRLKKIISEVKKINPQILIAYHSCGYIEPFIPHLIEAGVDILNPIQVECMDFKKIHSLYGDVLSFNGTIGTQKLMPFGTEEEIRKAVFENLEIAGEKGGLLCCPTHLLEPEVPWKNIMAYVNACKDFMKYN